jgi:hypothetical protein
MSYQPVQGQNYGRDDGYGQGGYGNNETGYNNNPYQHDYNNVANNQCKCEQSRRTSKAVLSLHRLDSEVSLSESGEREGGATLGVVVHRSQLGHAEMRWN